MSVTFGNNDRRLTEQLILYWHEKRQGRPFPDAKDFKEKDIPHLWMDCYFAKVTSSKQNGFEMIWQGENVRQLVGQMQPNEDVFYSAIMGCFHAIRDKKQPNVEEASVLVDEEHHYKYRQIAMPVGSSGGQVTHIFGGIRCKLFETTDEDEHLLNLDDVTEASLAAAVTTIPVDVDELPPIEVDRADSVMPEVTSDNSDLGKVAPPVAADGTPIIAKQSDGSFLSPSQMAAAMGDQTSVPEVAKEGAVEREDEPVTEKAPLKHDLDAFSEQAEQANEDGETEDAPKAASTTQYVPLEGGNFRD